MVRAREALRTYFGYDSFRPGQEDVISAILAGRDALAVMPTGAGKSICYQILQYFSAGSRLWCRRSSRSWAIRCARSRRQGIRGSYLNSTLTPRQQEVVMARAIAGWYDIMYVAPERLA
jgi:ATP-dependent DNA helicase RecQ